MRDDVGETCLLLENALNELRTFRTDNYQQPARAHAALETLLPKIDALRQRLANLIDDEESTKPGSRSRGRA